MVNDKIWPLEQWCCDSVNYLKNFWFDAQNSQTRKKRLVVQHVTFFSFPYFIIYIIIIL
jgi:hypothetical protein